MNWHAVRTSAFLCALFVLVYGGTSHLTSLRSAVPSANLEWERDLPFVAAMIVPYMSIDLFFVGAPFLCRDDRQRRVLSNRVTAAILIAGVCFLLFPLRFAFERPRVDGLLGAVFDNFRAVDPPFNQFPSLHIALQIILLAVYLPNTRGLVRVAVGAWFALIAASTLLTWQHHAIDVLGGAILGGLCLHLFDVLPLRQPVARNASIGTLYAGGAVALIGVAVALHPRGLALLWPAMALSVVATGYFGAGAGIFRKTDGRLGALTRLLLWPVLLGQRVSLAIYARRSPPWSMVTDRLWIGRRLTASQCRAAIESGVSAVLDLTGEFAEDPSFRALTYRQLPILDLTAPTRAQLDEAIAFIAERQSHGVVYVHCKAGYSRSAAVAVAYLLVTEQASDVDQAIAMLRAARPCIVIRTEIRAALEAFKPAAKRATSSACAVFPSPGQPAR